MAVEEVFLNDTGCVLTRSAWTGEVLCRWPGQICDCDVVSLDPSYANHPVRSELMRDIIDGQEENDA